jgi:2-polyprenyl-3-methyl-5-hydroxy-6-metoxy-1,4-benzoquinol methylase
MDRGDRIYVKRHFRRWLDIARILEEIVEQNGSVKILDVGCGSGFFMLMFGGGLTGLDNAENVEVCKKRGLQAYSIDLEKDYFPFENQSFDVAVCLEVLEHLENPKNVISEIFRVLTPNGYLLVSTPNNRVPIWRIRDFLLKLGFVSRIYMGRKLGSDQKRYSKYELERMLLSHDFEIRRSFYSRILLPRDDLLIVAQKRSRELN